MKGSLYIVGIGPGDKEYFTVQALQVLEQADIICGYTVYVDLVRAIFPEKQFLSTGMTKEVERCRLALEKASEGLTVAMVCSGDCGIYGMAGLVLELQVGYPDVQVELIPGLTAAISGAAILGAPLMNDFAVISLSDLMTPWTTIEKRLACAAQADFVICLYNPSSKKRKDYLNRACDIILSQRDADTVCGWVRNIGREGQSSGVLPLSELRVLDVDMFTTVFIGNTMTEELQGRMVTPRGYEVVR